MRGTKPQDCNHHVQSDEGCPGSAPFQQVQRMMRQGNPSLEALSQPPISRKSMVFLIDSTYPNSFQRIFSVF